EDGCSLYRDGYMISYGIFVIHILFLALLALLLHYQQTKLGLTPLLFFLASLIVILNFTDLMEIQLEAFPGYVLRTGGHVYVPIILMTVLVLYIANGTSRAQLVLFALTGINLLVVVTIAFMMAYINLRDESTILRALVLVDDVFTPQFLRGVLASLVAFVADVFMIAIVRQGLRNLFHAPDWICAGLALLVALWVDSIVFQILFNIGTPSFVILLPGDIVGKSLAALLIWPLLAVYLVRFAPQLPNYQGKTQRPTFDMLFGIFGSMNQAMSRLQAELKTSREIYTQLTENIQEVFWLADVNQDRIVYFSPAFKKITGYDPTYFYNNPQWLRGIILPEDQTTTGHKLLAALDDPEQERFRIRRRDGNTRW
ncbi:MAG: PAS domain-containing protein, partial [Anaerolineae bacterium]|nr:PAS domain-containing protein [Anaerolineae bacterium]